jgi:hypothetical protein
MQRTNKRILDRGEPGNGMTAERAARLDALGFAWEGLTCAATWAATWEEQLAKLEAYNAEHGDCNVPRGWAEDPSLGKWVSMQRTNKRILDRGEPGNGMTAERAARLDALGFAWEGSTSRSNRWEAQLPLLVAYKAKHGDCNVPENWAEDLSLGEWVGRQRSGKRKMDRGEPGNGMTAERAARLDAIGFAWELPH